MRRLKIKNWKLTILVAVLVITGMVAIPTPTGAVAIIHTTVHYLNDLLDVNTPAPTNNYIIYWNNTSGYWEARAEDIFACTDLASCNLTALGNVDTFFLTNYDFLIYNNYTGMWENEILSSVALQVAANIALQQIGNVNGTLLDNYIIYWDNGAGEFRMRLESTFSCGDLASCNISELGNVNASSLADGDFLSYSTGLGYWQNRQLAGGDMGAIGLGDLGNVNTTPLNDNDILFWNNTASEWQTKAESGGGGTWNCTNLSACNITDLSDGLGVKTVSITFIIDGICATIAAGEKGHLEIPFNCTIQRVTIEADQTGTVVVDIWKDTYANFPPTNADSITSVTPPTITTAQKSQDATLTNWTTSISTGDILAYNVDSCTNITRVTISLKAIKT